jgi:hypothetical protein
MTTNQRFCLNQDRYIIDRLNPTKPVECHCAEDESTDDMHLREEVLWIRLAQLVAGLIINTNPMERRPDGGEYQPHCEEMLSISLVLYNTIKASHLNMLDVVLSIQHRFDGELKREEKGWQDCTSLSLFVDDVERLLRDLYGEADTKAVDRVRHAVLRILEECAKYMRNDLWQEHQNAVDVDYMCGIGVPEGCGIHSSDHRRGHRAARDLELRTRAVRANPAAFSKYTARFVNELFANWPRLAEPTERVLF